MTLSKVHVNKDTTIDLADHELLLLPNRNLEINTGKIKIRDGSIVADHSFGYIDIRDVKGPVKLEFENVDFKSTTGANSLGGKTNSILKGF